MTAKANNYPRSCTMFAVSALSDIPDTKIIKAFIKTGCYKEEDGSSIFKLKETLIKLGIIFEDHFTNRPNVCKLKKLYEAGKNCYLVHEIPLAEVIADFRKGNHLVQVYVKDSGYHTIGVSSGMYKNIEIEKLDRTFYLGHFTITGITPKWKNIR